jgi:hypothetical protein
MSLDSYAFADKLILAKAGSVLIGYVRAENNELKFDEKKYFTIHASSFNNWVNLMYEVLNNNSGTVAKGKETKTSIVFDSFNSKKEYVCKIDFVQERISICKKFDSNEVINLDKPEIIEILCMLSFFIVPCFGLPPTITLCFLHIISHFSVEPHAMLLESKAEFDWKKIEDEMKETDLLTLVSGAVADLNLDIDPLLCYNSIKKFENVIAILVEMRLIRKMFSP